MATVSLEALAVTAEQLEDPLLELLGLILGDELPRGNQQRRVADDPRLAIDHTNEAVERSEAVLLAGLLDVLPRLLHRLGGGDLGQVGEEGVDVEARVPDVEVPHRGELAHRLAVGADRAEDRSAGLLRGEVAVAPGDREARRKALDVPLPGPRKGLVEVVDVQHLTAVRGGEDAEVREVGIAACLDPQPGLGGLREVHRHDRRRAAKERERRGEHPPVADRHQLLDTALGLILEHLDRISPARRRLPFAVARARNLLPRRLAGGCALLWGGGVHERRLGGSVIGLRSFLAHRTSAYPEVGHRSLLAARLQHAQGEPWLAAVRDQGDELDPVPIKGAESVAFHATRECRLSSEPGQVHRVGSRPWAAVNSLRPRFRVAVSLGGVHLLVGRWFASGVSHLA